jgi:hypothetical protein
MMKKASNVKPTAQLPPSLDSKTSLADRLMEMKEKWQQFWQQGIASKDENDPDTALDIAAETQPEAQDEDMAAMKQQERELQSVVASLDKVAEEITKIGKQTIEEDN